MTDVTNASETVDATDSGVRDDVAVTVEGQAVILDDAGITDPASAEVVNPFRTAVKQARNMSKHDRVFQAADLLAETFYNVSGVEATVSVTRSATLRGARVTFDGSMAVDGVEVLGAGFTGLTMEESVTFLAGASAMLTVIASLNPEIEAIDTDLINAAA